MYIDLEESYSLKTAVIIRQTRIKSTSDVKGQ